VHSEALEGVRRFPYPATLALLAITAAMAPAYLVRWHVRWYPTDALEVAIVVTVLVFAAESVRARALPARWPSALAIPTLLLLAAGAVAVVHSPTRIAGAGLYRAYFLEPVAFAVVAFSVVRTGRQAWLVVAGLWAGGAVLALANIDLVLTAIRHHQLDVRGNAPVALYDNPNSVAMFLVPLVGLAGAALLHARDRPVRAAAGVFLAIAVPASILTFSRGGWLALAAVAVVVVLSHRWRWWLLGCTAAAAVAIAAVPSIRHRFLLQFEAGKGNTAEDRLRLWSTTLKILRHDPLLGTGLGGFRSAVLPVWHWDTTWILYAHNIFLSMWVELGLLGLLSFAWIFGATGVVSWRGWRLGEPGWRAVQLGVLAALAAVLVHGMVDTPYFKNDLSLEFWTLVALAWAGRHWGSTPARAPTSVPEPTAEGRLSRDR
jgi:putative inorganic carbon (hco3(-)) transporter